MSAESSGSNQVSHNHETNSMTRKKKKKEDFVFSKILGEGSYSSVYLAKEVATDREFAIKILVKQHIIREKKVPQVSREKEVLAMTNHPFIVKLYFTFQDKEHLYYGLSYAKRGELLQYVMRLGSFDEECTRFYSAELIVALNYLHSLGIIHRDLKPENVLLSEDMHIKLADFGTAKVIKNENETCEGKDNKKANSFVGTAQYVSPELLSDKVCYKSSDLWALGCIIYQLLAGQPPFRAPNEYFIFQKIIKLEFSFPDGFPSVPQDLISNLLVLDPKQRIGCEELGGNSALQSHPFYEGIDFEDIHNQIPPKLKIYLPSNDPNQPGIYEDFDISSVNNCDDDIDNWVLDPLSLDAAVTVTREPFTKSVEELHKLDLKKQEKESPWHQFVDGNLILKMGILDKRKGLFAKRRQFLITEGPGIYYVDPKTMSLKGKIPWSKDLKPEMKSFQIFFIHTPRRTYYLEDPGSRATDWVKKIEEVHSQYFPKR